MAENGTAVSQDCGFVARCLLRRTCWGTLATQRDGQPFTSLVTHAVAPDGAVLMLLSDMALNTKHLVADARCAVMVTGKPENLNWHTAPRLTVTGDAIRLDGAAQAAARRYWVSHHPYANLYADFSDFGVWRLVPQAGHFVAGFGRIHRLEAGDLACPPPAVAALGEAHAGLVARCNAEHAADLGRLAHAAGHAGRWSMMGLDPDGFTLVQDETVLRVAFEAPVQDAAGAAAALIALIRSERSGQFHP